MTDYKNLKLIATSNPHIRSNETTRSIMLDVIIAMLPALAFAIFNFGLRALTLTAVSVVGCVFWEWLYRKLMKKPQSIGDLSSVVTGMLLAFVCPVQMPYWMIIIGDFFAIVVVKQLFGGIGKNFLNPALAGRAVLLASYAGTMTSWVDPAVNKAAIIGSNADIVTTATPLAIMKTGDFAELLSAHSVGSMFVGTGIPGSLGEVSALALLIGGVYLIWRKVINWQTPVAYIATVAVLTFLFPKQGSGLEWMLYSIFGGGLFLGAFFMATDYATSPVTKKGQLIFGIGCGLFTVLIRYFGSYNEGVCYSIMVMNLFVALIDKYTKPTRFGVVKSDKKEAAAK
ncbi:RnfABCDGE type electron transport complex subunit D [Oscillibacter valericigenes]|uniref:RnfABCDGE type electron transport complex subunit D n=1 Tax=Oscillibacter valericigenes TaxID=351091 RepID=UPI001F16A9F1|nr:RnfABCDGE type electron transport complex subunit D [Oscillibacter valericigenes]MCF2617024.1 RnfABCDGE type electron transport complex subunit D [Oscillibacter valericigenes]